MPELPAAASAGLGEVLSSYPRPGRVAAVWPAAAYVEVRGTPWVVAVVTRGGVALPNAVVVAMKHEAAPFAGVTVGQAARVGGGKVDLGGLVVRVRRWWDPVPRLGHVHPAALAERLAVVERLLPAWPPPRAPVTLAERGAVLEAASLRLDTAAAATAIGDLIGLGPGLTPAGDDVVASLVAGVRLLAGAVAGPALGVAPALDQLVTALTAAVVGAAGRTTWLSAALLRHATRGEVAAPVAGLLAGLAGRAAPAVAVERLLGIGHTSGHDLATGLVMAARTIARLG